MLFEEKRWTPCKLSMWCSLKNRVTVCKMNKFKNLDLNSDKKKKKKNLDLNYVKVVVS